VSHGAERFFERATDQIMRGAVVLLDLAGEPISIASIDRVINSLPTFPDQHEQQAWQEEAYCARLISQIRARKESLTSEEWTNLEVVADQFFRRWPALDDRPRSSIVATWSGIADRYLFNPYRRLFSSGQCSFTPEMTTHEGKLVLCDFPLLELGIAMGRSVNTLMRICFQRAYLRRDLSDSPNPVFIWADEAQYFLTKQDTFFQQTCRGSRVVNVMLTQNISNISDEYGESQSGSKTKSLLGNINLKIFHQQNDVDTCLYASDQIGKEYRFVENFTSGSGGDSRQAQTSVGGSMQLTHILEPIEFTRLEKPSSTNPLAAAIVYGGATFNATRTKANPSGRNFLRVHFSRD
jgi:hypothetical protein